MSIPRDCTHADFPLRQRERGGNTAWLGTIKSRNIFFGTVSKDPQGEMAWKLYDAERDEWLAGRNPRTAHPCRPIEARVLAAMKPEWLLAGPLAQVGLAIIDVKERRIMCLTCYRVWKIEYQKGTPRKRHLRCSAGCTPRPTGEVRDAINLAFRPQEMIEEAEYRELGKRLVKAKRQGWHTAPQNIDADATAEGKAIFRLAVIALRQRAKVRRATLSRSSLIAGQP